MILWVHFLLLIPTWLLRRNNLHLLQLPWNLFEMFQTKTIFGKEESRGDVRWQMKRKRGRDEWCRGRINKWAKRCSNCIAGSFFYNKRFLIDLMESCFVFSVQTFQLKIISNWNVYIENKYRFFKWTRINSK